MRLGRCSGAVAVGVLLIMAAGSSTGLAGCQDDWTETEFKQKDRAAAVSQPVDMQVTRTRVEGRPGCTVDRRGQETPGPADSYRISPSEGAEVVGGSFTASKAGVYTVTALERGKAIGSVRITVGEEGAETTESAGPVTQPKDPLVGEWSWTKYYAQQTDVTKSLSDWTWKARPSPTVFTIYRKDGAPTVKAGRPTEAQIILEGNAVSFIIYEQSPGSPDWQRETYRGVLDGDTITGTVKCEEWFAPPPGSAGSEIAKPPKPYTGAWTATRVE